jgi:hypothetical protein
MHHRRQRAFVCVALSAGLALTGCRRQAPTAAAENEPKAVENAELELTVAPLPAGIEVAENRGEKLTFDAVSDGVPGTLTVTVSPPDPSGVNLVAETKRFGAEATAAAGGKFFGGNELVTPSGSAFTARALVDGGTVEERRVFLLHPGGGDRLVTISLRYPPGDVGASRARMQQTMDFLAALQALPPGDAARP